MHVCLQSGMRRVCAFAPETQVYACVCVIERAEEKQGVDGSWWVSTPAAATSALGQLMFCELTGISPTAAVPNPTPLSFPFSLSLDRLPL